MKTTMLALLIVLAVGTAFAQDTTATPAGNFYADSLKSANYPVSKNGSVRDTVDVVVSSMSGADYFQITAWSTDADTLTVWCETPDKSRFVQRGVYNQAAGGSAAVECVTSTTVKDWILLGSGTESKLRFLSPGSTNAINFIIAGKRGEPVH